MSCTDGGDEDAGKSPFDGTWVYTENGVDSAKIVAGKGEWIFSRIARGVDVPFTRGTFTEEDNIVELITTHETDSKGRWLPASNTTTGTINGDTFNVFMGSSTGHQDFKKQQGN